MDFLLKCKRKEAYLHSTEYKINIMKNPPLPGSDSLNDELRLHRERRNCRKRVTYTYQPKEMPGNKGGEDDNNLIDLDYSFLSDIYTDDNIFY